ncbi:MAG TPA: FtsX-like permease family protein, partial [Blastocatellia bacterium]
KDFDGRGLAIEDHPTPPAQEMSADMYVVTPGYLDAMGIRLIKGRMLSDQDVQSSPFAALINEGFAAEYWPNGDPLGKRIRFPGIPGSAPEWRTIVGVVGDVDQYGLDKGSIPQFYLPEAQYPLGRGSLAVRTKTAPSSLAGAIRAEVHSLDKDLVVYDVATMVELMQDSISVRRSCMLLLSIFALLALVLAAIGIYGVISYSVSQRTSEIGIRMALGASRREIIRLVLANGMTPVAIGAALGTACALATTRFMSSLLFQVSPLDPTTFAIILAGLLVVALSACYVPARRACQTDPMIALRCE